MVCAGAEKIGNVMNERFDLDHLCVMIKPGFLAVILPEGMKLIDQKFAIWAQRLRCLGEDKVQIRNMFEDEIADN